MIVPGREDQNNLEERINKRQTKKARHSKKIRTFKNSWKK